MYLFIDREADGDSTNEIKRRLHDNGKQNW